MTVMRDILPILRGFEYEHRFHPFARCGRTRLAREDSALVDESAGRMSAASTLRRCVHEHNCCELAGEDPISRVFIMQ